MKSVLSTDMCFLANKLHRAAIYTAPLSITIHMFSNSATTAMEDLYSLKSQALPRLLSSVSVRLPSQHIWISRELELSGLL
jgi:hypothetical protein